MNEEELWQLQWRMHESVSNKNYTLAETQFDSLNLVSNKLDFKFLAEGLKVKEKLNKTKEVVNILARQDEKMLNQLCQISYLKNLASCKAILIKQPTNDSLQLELVKMYINDQYVRSNLLQDLLSKYNLKKSEVIVDSFGMRTDETNTDKLKEIIKLFGFPNEAMVGADGMASAFLVIQHSEDHEWQKSQLSNIDKAVKNGDLDAGDYAFLYDRIKMRCGEKQLYGSQIAHVDFVRKNVQLFPIEDPENLDKRRREMGMMPIEMYKRLILIQN